MDEDLLNSLKEGLQNDEKDFLTHKQYLDLKQKIFLKYPLLFKRLGALGRMMLSKEMLPKCVINLIDFCINYWYSLPVRQISDYDDIQKGEDVKSEYFPLWDIKKKRARYQALSLTWREWSAKKLMAELTMKK